MSEVSEEEKQFVTVNHFEKYMLEYVAVRSGERTEKIEETRLLILHEIDSKII